MLARRFAEKYITDNAVLEIIETHDEAFNAWQKGARNGNWEKAGERAMKLVKRLGDNIGMYLDFYLCDNETGDKKADNYEWFKALVFTSC